MKKYSLKELKLSNEEYKDSPRFKYLPQKYFDEFKKLNDDGITIIMVSHDLQAAINYASHILHVGKSQLFFGEKDDYLESCAFKKFSGFGGDM